MIVGLCARFQIESRWAAQQRSRKSCANLGRLDRLRCSGHWRIVSLLRCLVHDSLQDMQLLP